MNESDVSNITNALALGKSALDVLRRAVGLIRDDTERKTAEIALEDAKRALDVSEVQVARNLGQPLHYCDFPPGIFVLRNEEFVCRKCGYTAKSGVSGGGAW